MSLIYRVGKGFKTVKPKNSGFMGCGNNSSAGIAMVFVHDMIGIVVVNFVS